MALEPRDIIEQHIVQAPMAKLLGVRLEEFAPDLVRVRLPFRAELTTIGDLVHGGALSALIDIAATAAAWSRADLERSPRGTTIGFHVSFLAGANGRDAVATARVIQRGSSVVVSDVEVADDQGSPIARAIVTYKLTHRDAAA